MKQIKRIIYDTCTYLFVFLGIQIVCQSFLLLSPDLMLNPWALGLSLSASSIITMVLYRKAKWWKENLVDAKKIDWKVYALIAVLAITSFLPSLGMLEAMGVEANEMQEKVMMDIIKSPLGFIVIALLVPMAEEIVFRGSILRALLEHFRISKQEKEQLLKEQQEKDLLQKEQLLKKNVNVKTKDGVWLSIVISSLLFGIVHGNLAQFIHATLLGILLGWIYYNTKSIMPGVILHFLNNGIAFMVVILDPTNNDASLIDLFNGNQTLMYVTVIASTLLLALAIWMLYKFFCNEKKVVDA